MGWATLKAQAEARQLRKALKVPPEPRNKDGEDPYHLAHCYVADAAKALGKALETMAKQGNGVASNNLNAALGMVNTIRADLYKRYRNRRRR